MYYKLYSDAAAQQNTKQSSAGVLIIKNKHQTQLKTPLSASDNHTAEFEACIFAFESLLNYIKPADRATAIIAYYTDSKILAESITKQYAKHYQPYVDKIIKLQSQFQLVLTNWIPDSENKGAHELAQQALIN